MSKQNTDLKTVLDSTAASISQLAARATVSSPASATPIASSTPSTANSADVVKNAATGRYILTCPRTITITFVPDWSQLDMQSPNRPLTVSVVLGARGTLPQHSRWNLELLMFCAEKPYSNLSESSSSALTTKTADDIVAAIPTSASTILTDRDSFPIPSLRINHLYTFETIRDYLPFGEIADCCLDYLFAIPKGKSLRNFHSKTFEDIYNTYIPVKEVVDICLDYLYAIPSHEGKRMLLWHANAPFPTFEQALVRNGCRLSTADELRTVSVTLRTHNDENNPNTLVYVRPNAKLAKNGSNPGFLYLMKKHYYYLNITFAAGSTIAELVGAHQWRPLIYLSATQANPTTGIVTTIGSRVYTHFNTNWAQGVEHNPEKVEREAAEEVIAADAKEKQLLLHYEQQHQMQFLQRAFMLMRAEQANMLLQAEQARPVEDNIKNNKVGRN